MKTHNIDGTEMTEDQAESQAKLITLSGGLNVVIKTESNNGESTVFVRQFKIAEYVGLLPIAEDEMELVNKACDKPTGWCLSVTPESYEELVATMEKVNAKGFFVYSRRQQERQDARMSRRIAAMPKELIQQTAKAIATSSNTSPTGALGLRPR